MVNIGLIDAMENREITVPYEEQVSYMQSAIVGVMKL